jgi:hypothetical protein
VRELAKPLSISLRSRIFSHLRDSDGAYVIIYSGTGEKLVFLSCMFGAEDSSLARILLDLNINKYSSLINRNRSVLIDCASKRVTNDSLESSACKELRQSLMDLSKDHRFCSSRVLVVADCSSFLCDTRGHLDESSIAFHEDSLNLIRSTQGVTGVLLYNLDSLTEESVRHMLQLHIGSREITEKFSLLTIRQELQKGLENTSTAEILVRGHWLLFTDPATSSAALLLPLSSAVKEVLPCDPLNQRDRDIAFANNFTAGEGTCPYLADDVRSQCILDPNVVKIEKTIGRPFAKGRPCETATDYLVLEEKTVQQLKPAQCSESQKKVRA